VISHNAPDKKKSQKTSRRRRKEEGGRPILFPERGGIRQGKTKFLRPSGKGGEESMGGGRNGKQENIENNNPTLGRSVLSITRRKKKKPAAQASTSCGQEKVPFLRRTNNAFTMGGGGKPTNWCQSGEGEGEKKTVL